MGQRKKWITACLPVLAIGMLMSGCGQGMEADSPPAGVAGQAQTQAKPAISSEPLTLKVFQSSALITDDEFNSLIAGAVKKKYPNISMEIIRSGPDQKAEELVAAGTFPDMIYTDNRRISNYTKLGLGYDLREPAKANQFDLNIFDPVAMESIKMFGTQGEVYAFPFSINFAANWYNKDIFDKFAAPYPKDLMTWDELIDLAKRVGRSDNGVQYRALDPGGIGNFVTVLRLPLIDPKTGKAALELEGWKNTLTLFGRIYNEIPGNAYSLTKRGKDAFLKDRTTAMLLDYGGRIGDLDAMYRQGTSFNWDVASYPNFKDMPGKGWELNAPVMMISSTTKYKNEAFRALEAISSKENQLTMTKSGRLAALKDADMKKFFGVDLESMKGKNLQGIFKNEHVPGVYRTDDDNLVQSQLSTASTQVAQGKADVNTALKQANEKANKALEENAGK